MTFYYHLFGHAGSLNLYTALGDNLGIQLWTRQGTQGDIWRFGRMSINQPGANVVFEAVAGANAVGDVSIDDVMFTQGACSESSAIGESCTFVDYSVCGFTQNATASSLIWQTYSGGEQRAALLPFDHTTGTSRGSYIYIDLDGQGENLNGRLISPLYPSIVNQSRCLEFYYALVGSSNTFNVYMESTTGSRRLIFTRDYDHGQVWNKGEVTITSSNEFRLVFEILTGRARAGLITLDDFMIKEGQCGMQIDECTFDDGTLCAWTNAPDNNFDWLLQKGQTTTLNTGPNGDHSTGNGNYIFIETSLPAETGWKARLESEIYFDNRVKCVSFWYNMYGVDIDRLNLYIRSLTSTNISSESLIWTLAGPQGIEWKYGLAPIQPNGRYQVIVEGVRGKSFEGDIAIDDIGVLNNDACSLKPIDADPIQVSIEAISCRFETDMCQWKHDPTGQFNWTRHTESTSTLNTGPSSGANNSPYYIYIEASLPRQPSDRAGLISPVITKPKRPSCFSFYYHMWGADIGALLISTIQSLPNGDKQQTYIWTRNETQSQEWRVAHINLRNIPNDFAIQIDGYVGVGHEGDIAVDEIWLTDQECPPPSSCDFELDFCGWTNDTTSDFFWTRAQNETATIGTGPSTDHTTQTARGYYLHIETSAPQTPGQKARIVSPMYTPSSSVCLRFYYHMFGPSIGTLNILIAGSTQLLWTQSGNLGNRWRYGHATVRSNDPYQIAFEGIVGSGFDGDIAIDDIELVNGPCGEDGSCDFERGYCGFYNVKEEDNFDWVLNRGETITADTGPTVDHTTQTGAGQYVYIESSYPQGYGDKAWLVSEVLESPRGACLEFWYHMKGNTTGNLSVHHRILDRPPTSLWFMGGDQGDRWLNSKVDIPATAEHYDFLFQGVVGDGFESDIALDDVQFTQGDTCAYLASTTPSPVTPPSTLFECDFEDGTTCEWQDETSTKPWRVSSGETAIFGQAPLTDHTKQNVKGKYAVVPVESTGGPLYYSTIGFRDLPRGLSICLDFWYQVFVSSDTTLNVYLQNGTSATVMIWQRPGTTARDQWTHATVNLGVILASMDLTMSAGVVPRSIGYVAIDDVKLINGVCQSVRICDFEDPLICGYQNDATADFVWERNSGATSSAGTGPSNDHTYESKVGHYMFIETSSPRRPGEKARLISPEYSVTADGSCLQFFYHMYGQDTGALNVFLKSGGTLLSVPLWSLAGNQGDLWRPARVSMLAAAKFQVVFEGIVGPGFLGDISIDDISVLPGACGGQGSCTFEQDLCTWTPSKNTSYFDWYRLSSKQISLLYNGTNYPQVDTTIGTQFGHFLWAASDFRTNHQNQTSRLYSEILLADKNQVGACLTFSYFITGSSSLRVFSRKRPEGSNSLLLWTMENDRGNAWLRDQIDFQAVAEDFEIYFEGKFNYPGMAGSIAVDDIYIHSTPCAQVASTPPTTPEYTTTNTPSIGPSATNAPTTGPSTTNTPSIGPSTTNTPNIGPSATNASSTGPLTTNTPNAGPSTTNTPSIGPSTTNTPSTGPLTTNTPNAGPSTTNTPSIGPSTTNTPSTGPLTTNTPNAGPSTTNTPSTRPSTTNTPSIGPSTTNTPNIGPSATNTPSTGPLITTTTTRTTAVLATTTSSTPTPPDTTTRSMAIASYDSLFVLILLCAIIARLPFEE